MTISIITSSFEQLNWLKLCIASVADQVAPAAQGAEGKSKVESLKSKARGDGRDRLQKADPERAAWLLGGSAVKVGSAESNHLRTFAPSKLPTNRLAIEHIIQDGGTPGIEGFAKGMGEELMLRYGGELVSDLQTFELLHFRTASGYTLRVFKEPDAGMYDALNKGIARMSGDLWAWINSDE